MMKRYKGSMIGYWRDSRPRRNVAAVILVVCSPALNAEFTLNFSPNPNIVSNIANVHCTSGGGDGTQPGGGGWGGGGGFRYYGCGSGYFIQEVVRDRTLGDYYHVIVGDPRVDDFALEFYQSGNYNAASGGNWNNAHDPLGDSLSVTGNGTGQPRRTYMRMINNDTGFNQEFIKSSQTQKPKIIQNIADGPMNQTFAIDMTNSNYNQANIVGTVINKLIFTGADAPKMGEFDMATDAQNPTFNAGRYTYVAGSGPEGSVGRYNYSFGDFDVYEVDWPEFCDPIQNPDHRCDFNRGGGGWSSGGWGGGGGGGGGGGW